ncbi:aminopeptidase [Candidatus Woesearchaeota archaeon]|nr:aminopeptidase [Candidatus Woesearchaeota archaeon]
METVESLNWLRQNNLYSEAERVSLSIKKVFSSCLGIKDEKILVIGDTGLENKNVAAVMSGAYYLAAKQLNLDSKLIFQKPKSRGEEAEEQIISSLSQLKEGNVIILNMSDKLGSMGDLGKSFRKWIKKKNHRFVSAMSLGDLETEKINTIVGAMDISYKPFQASHERLKKLFDESDEIRITTDAGTDLTYNIKGIEGISADGNYTLPGSGGNLPAGEVYAPPNGKRVEGKVVIDGSSRVQKGTILVNDPITLKIGEGNILSIEGGKEAKALQETLDWAASQAKNPGSVRRICELGIGLNPKAQLIGATIVDDKVLGTAHIGIGSNYWFGGTIYAIIHLDQVFKNPKVYFDGKLVDIS